MHGPRHTVATWLTDKRLGRSMCGSTRRAGKESAEGIFKFQGFALPRPGSAVSMRKIGPAVIYMYQIRL